MVTSPPFHEGDAYHKYGIGYVLRNKQTALYENMWYWAEWMFQNYATWWRVGGNRHIR